MSAWDDLKPKCKHGVRVDRHCSRCMLEAHSGPRVTRLADVRVPLPPEPLNLPPLGPHVASVTQAKGKWTVSCGCGGFRARSSERHEIETAWGRHRGT